MVHNISLRSPTNPTGDSISDALFKLDQNIRGLHDFVHGMTLPAGTYTKIVVDASGRISAASALNATDVNAAFKTGDLLIKSHLSIIPHQTATASGSKRSLLTLTDGTSRDNLLHLHQIRHTEATKSVTPQGWDTLTTRIEMQSDNSGQGWIDFNPENAAGAVLIGASDALNTRRRNPTLLITHEGIKVNGSIVPNGVFSIGSEDHGFHAVYAEHLHGVADRALRLDKQISINLNGDATGKVTFEDKHYAGHAASLKVNLSSVVRPGTYSRVIVDEKGRVVDGGPLSAEDVMKVIQRPGSSSTFARIYRNKADALGGVIIEHNVENALETILDASGLYLKDDVLHPMNLVRIDKSRIEMNGAAPFASLRIMITILNGLD